VIASEHWSAADWRAYLDGWSFERIGTPKPPPGSHGPEARKGAEMIVHAMPNHLRAGAIDEALKSMTPQVREGLFFDMGRVGASGA
jgi:hypothetical protein